MVSSGFSDDEELPPGWREHVKVTNGRKIKFYSHSESGLRLYSKKRVWSLDQMALKGTLRPLGERDQKSITAKNEEKMMVCEGSSHSSRELNQKSITTRSQDRVQAFQGTLQSSSEQQQMPKSEVDPVVVETNASLDWLPFGWIVESKVRKTGASAGNPYKKYVDPSTGCKFNSKPKVMKYLENVYGKSMSEKQNVKQEVSGGISYQQKVPRIIPIEEKTVTCAMDDIQATKVSLDFSVDKSFEQEAPQIIPKNKKMATYVKDDSRAGKSSVVSKSTRLDELPPGWVKELRARKGDPNKNDPYYIDPDSGYEFRSKKDVQRYLETGDISRCAMKPQPRRHVLKSEHFISTPTRTTCIRLGLNTIDHQGVVSSSASATLLDWKQSKAENSKETKNGCIFAEPRLELGYIDNKKLHSEDTSRTTTRTRSQLLHEQKHQDLLEAKTEIEQKKSLKRKSLSVPIRSSKRLSGVEPDLLPVSNERVICAAVKKDIQGQTRISSIMENGFPHQPGTSTHQPTKVFEDPCEVASPSKEHEVQERPKQKVMKVQEALEIPKQVAWKVEEVQEKPEQAAEQVDNVQERREVENSLYPFGDYLADPCYEFAFKTLTEEIPFEDTLAFQSLFRQPGVEHGVTSCTQSVVSMGLPAIGTPSLFQNDIPFQLDSVHNKALTYQMPKNSSS